MDMPDLPAAMPAAPQPEVEPLDLADIALRSCKQYGLEAVEATVNARKFLAMIPKVSGKLRTEVAGLASRWNDLSGPRNDRVEGMVKLYELDEAEVWEHVANNLRTLLAQERQVQLVRAERVAHPEVWAITEAEAALLAPNDPRMVDTRGQQVYDYLLGEATIAAQVGVLAELADAEHDGGVQEPTG